MKTLVCPDADCGCRDIETLIDGLHVCCKCDIYFVTGENGRSEIVDVRDIPHDPEFGLGCGG